MTVFKVLRHDRLYNVAYGIIYQLGNYTNCLFLSVVRSHFYIEIYTKRIQDHTWTSTNQSEEKHTAEVVVSQVPNENLVVLPLHGNEFGSRWVRPFCFDWRLLGVTGGSGMTGVAGGDKPTIELTAADVGDIADDEDVIFVTAADERALVRLSERRVFV